MRGKVRVLCVMCDVCVMCKLCVLRVCVYVCVCVCVCVFLYIDAVTAVPFVFVCEGECSRERG